MWGIYTKVTAHLKITILEKECFIPLPFVIYV